MKKVNFGSSNFFGLGHFLIHHIWNNDQKITQAKKILHPKVLIYDSTTQEFLKSMFYYQTFLSDFCHSCALPFLRQNVKEGHESTQNY